MHTAAICTPTLCVHMLTSRFFHACTHALANAGRYENVMVAGIDAGPNFTRHTVSAAVPMARFVTVARINNDAYPDIVAAHEGGSDGCVETATCGGVVCRHRDS